MPHGSLSRPTARFARGAGLLLLAALSLSRCATGINASAGASAEPWPPVMLANDDHPLPALAAAHARCWALDRKHDWFIFASLSLADDRQSLAIDERSREWIESYYGHSIDTGVRHSTYDLTWITDYLGHPLPEGYFIWGAQVCVLGFLGAPPGIVDDMIATRADDGEREATWGNFRVTWTNDGETGPDAVVTYHRP